MKKVLLLSSVIIILGLTGCSNKYFNDWFSSEQNETDKMCQQIIEACKQQDGIIPQTVFLLEDKIDFCYERTLKYKFRMV